MKRPLEAKSEIFPQWPAEGRPSRAALQKPGPGKILEGEKSEMKNLTFPKSEMQSEMRIERTDCQKAASHLLIVFQTREKRQF